MIHPVDVPCAECMAVIDQQCTSEHGELCLEFHQSRVDAATFINDTADAHIEQVIQPESEYPTQLPLIGLM